MQTVSLVDFETASPTIATLLMSAADSREVVAAFTDEELVALDGLGEEQVAPALWLDTQPADRRELAATVAMRGLIARGLVAAIDDHQEADRVVLSMPDEVMATLAMRRSASSILIAEQQTDSGKRARVVYVHGDLGVLEEDVNPGGLHTLSVCPLAMALDRLAEWCDLTHVAGELDGAEQHIPLIDYSSGGEVPRTLDQAKVVTVVASVTEPSGPGAEPGQGRLTVYSFDDHVKVAHRVPERPDVLAVRDVGGPSLRHALGRLLGEAA